MPKISEIIVVNGHGLGEYCDVKRIPSPGETCTAYNRRFEMDAGKGTNMACVIGRLGGSVSFVNKAGCDMCGELGVKWMTESNVDISYYWMDPSIDSCLGLCIIAENGENMLLDFDDDTFALQPDEAERIIRKLKGAKYLVAGFSQAVETGLKACEIGHEMGMYTLLNASPLRDDLVLPEMPYVDVICINEVEARLMLDIAENAEVSYEELSKKLLDRYKCGNVIITLGSKGSCAYTAGGDYWFIPATKVKMVDETGAGDAFIAAVAFRLNKGDTLKQAMDWASVYSAYCVTQPGSLEPYPRAEQMPQIFKDLGREDLLNR